MIHDIKDRFLYWLSLSCSLAAIAIMLSLYIFIARESLPIWTEVGPIKLLLHSDWQPLGKSPSFGFFTMIVSTFWASAGAMLLAAPVGLGCGIFLSEYAPRLLAAFIRGILSILTGIPSVVYGFLGASIIVPWHERITGVPSGESLFCASLVLSVMIVPYIVAGTYSAYKSISPEYREAAYVLGVSKPYVIQKVLTPLAARSLASAVTLAFARASGETMAVLMLSGNTLTMPLSWFSKGEPLSALIALEIGTAEVGSHQYQALFAAGLVLLLFVSSINLAIYFINGRRHAQ